MWPRRCAATSSDCVAGVAAEDAIRAEATTCPATIPMAIVMTVIQPLRSMCLPPDDNLTAMSEMRTTLLVGQEPARFLFESQVLAFLDGDPNEQDRPAFESARRLILLAHGVSAVEAHTEAIARQRELAGLCFHVA